MNYFNEKLSNPTDRKTSGSKPKVTNLITRLILQFKCNFTSQTFVFTRAFLTQSESHIHTLSKAVYLNSFFLYISFLIRRPCQRQITVGIGSQFCGKSILINNIFIFKALNCPQSESSSRFDYSGRN